jgi:hypothetical protein
MLIQKVWLYNDVEISLTKFFDKKIGGTPKMKCLRILCLLVLSKNKNANK